ncbi:tyrosine-type recombinase/integrase [Leptolyngbya sp. NIES-2104]|uniref:tyrosine-type recombinase/integrase n=1 Tax=Leptolyngbya sp. NIES-2104 TaxID=1552121 RepID=UPI0006EC76D3|nr:tyrosine-type recombinase/integrase [Leptolyngbya sp. NIES-2104]GAQ00143.1 site-specific recombinase, phage integrase family [Leptolyngbya sp. NIES-2104]
MPFQKGQNPNHPAPGSTIKVEPIRDKKAIQRIKKVLADHPRDLCLFTLGINTAYRANELLSIKVRQVRSLNVGDVLELKQSKTHKYRPVTLNGTAISAIQHWLGNSQLQDEDNLFTGQRGCLTVTTVSTMVKTWCQDVGLKGNYGSHTLRKTWGYWQRTERGTAIPLLMEAFGHATQRQTLAYLGIQSDEIAQIYELEL